MPRLPPVDISPQTRLRGEVLAGGDQLDGDLLPVALELLGDELREAGVRALSHLRAHDADHARVVGLDDDPRVELGSRAAAPCAAAVPMPNGSWKPSASPPPAAAERTMNLRRERLVPLPRILFSRSTSSRSGFRCCDRRRRRCRPWRPPGAPPPGCAGRCRSGRCWSSPRRCRVGRLRLLPEQRRGGHDLPRLAVAALRHVELRPRLLHGMRAVGRQALDGDDPVGGLHASDRDRTGADAPRR